jgi:PEP-CTERM motif-containing protein
MKFGRTFLDYVSVASTTERETAQNTLASQEVRVRSRAMPMLAALAMVTVLAPATSLATVINVDTMFAANDRSIWSTGSGFSWDSGPRFLGVNGWDLGDTVGGVHDECVFGVCASFGAELGARTSGRAGVGYGLKVDSGTMDIHYPARAQFDFPSVVPGVLSSSGAFKVNPMVTINTALTGVPGGLALPDQPGGAATLRSATLQVRGPQLQSFLDLAAALDAFAGLRACAGLCYEVGLGPLGFNASTEIAAINRDGDGTIRVFGNTLVSANQSISGLGGLINAQFNLPDLDSSSAVTPGGFDGFALTSSRRDSAAVVNANVAQIAADAFGLPIPLSGNYGGFGYNLLQAGVGAFFDLKETLEFVPSATAKLVFSSDVVPNIGGVPQAPTRIIDFRLGEDVSFTPVGLKAVGVEPVISLGGKITNRLDLVLGGNVDVKALGVNIAGLELGPLVNERIGSGDLGSIDINLLKREFDLGLGTVVGKPFNLSFPDCVVMGGSGEVSFPWGECALSGYGGGISGTDSEGFREDEIVQFGCTAHQFGTLPFCFQFPGAFTSPYFDGDFGDVFLGSPDARDFDPFLPGPSTDDESQLLALAALGYNGPPPFIIPEGAPFSAITVPEPATSALLGLAFAGLLAQRASRRRDSKRA